VDNGLNADENALVSIGESVLMQTATTEVKKPGGEVSMKTRLLLDCGSQRTYITESLANKLGLKTDRVEELNVVTFGNAQSKVLRTSWATLSLKLNNGEYLNIDVNIVPVISGDIQRRSFDFSKVRNFKHIVKSLDLADSLPTQKESTSIDLLIGNDYYLDLILAHKIEVAPGLYLLSSKLGWIISGRAPCCDKKVSDPSMLTLTYRSSILPISAFQSIDKVMETKTELEDFWNIEAIGIKDSVGESDDELAMKQFKDTLKFENGRYEVTWPWKEKSPDLPKNRELAFGRLKSV
jgi:hypothetical protein